MSQETFSEHIVLMYNNSLLCEDTECYEADNNCQSLRDSIILCWQKPDCKYTSSKSFLPGLSMVGNTL